ncbi:hypothetical protein [Sediminicoccus sp. KRV36]|uniref:hypothetical protein n=1 Tax=Sediminicoccus sp. KRV36 TaxID=3133721 RepID=UPI00200F3CCE|nr:hypothetical protein [Sediminicoccus rosea]UPY35037.1 hypothetical protein LHU95_12415 [Sediminicoccus rosea]
MDHYSRSRRALALGGLAALAASPAMARGRGGRGGGGRGGYGGGSGAGFSGLIGLGLLGLAARGWLKGRSEERWRRACAPYHEIATRYGCRQTELAWKDGEVRVTLWMEVHNVSFTVRAPVPPTSKSVVHFTQQVQRTLDESDARGRRVSALELPGPPPRRVKMTPRKARST